jgi:hypothetical protein
VKGGMSCDVYINMMVRRVQHLVVLGQGLRMRSGQPSASPVAAIVYLEVFCACHATWCVD